MCACVYVCVEVSDGKFYFAIAFVLVYLSLFLLLSNSCEISGYSCNTHSYRIAESIFIIFCYSFRFHSSHFNLSLSLLYVCEGSLCKYVIFSAIVCVCVWMCIYSEFSLQFHSPSCASLVHYAGCKCVCVASRVAPTLYLSLSLLPCPTLFHCHTHQSTSSFVRMVVHKIPVFYCIKWENCEVNEIRASLILFNIHCHFTIHHRNFIYFAILFRFDRFRFVMHCSIIVSPTHTATILQCTL